MLLRHGRTVLATDGPFGTVGDFRVDQKDGTFSHVVIDPDNRQDGGCLVPLWLLQDGPDGGLVVHLDTSHLRRLERTEVHDYAKVWSSDQHMVGRLDGINIFDDTVSSIVVRMGVPGLRHDVVVPMGAIMSIDDDRVDLQITKREFHRLPKMDVPTRQRAPRWT